MSFQKEMISFQVSIQKKEHRITHLNSMDLPMLCNVCLLILTFDGQQNSTDTYASCKPLLSQTTKILRMVGHEVPAVACVLRHRRAFRRYTSEVPIVVGGRRSWTKIEGILHSIWRSNDLSTNMTGESLEPDLMSSALWQ